MAFDIGGTFVKAVLLTTNGTPLKGSEREFPARSGEAKNVVLAHFYDMIRELADTVTEEADQFSGIGYAFPGPFDYETGVSYMQGIGKFDAIYGVNMKEAIQAFITADAQLVKRFSNDFLIVFENDARIFGLGAAAVYKSLGVNKLIALTLGTGLGSAFINQGQIVTKGGQGIPLEGYLYHVPYEDSIFDDYFSRRGILRIFARLGLEAERLDVKGISELAEAGDPIAVQVFSDFGEALGRALLLFVEQFQPDAIVIGGQISKSMPLFKPALALALNLPMDMLIQTDTMTCTMKGIWNLIIAKQNLA
ncbi:ROK family protein [Paenibacillus sp. N3.4]|uniref:ROK family protein n=1 Tax=Paenibacillus sp. N3.4 TaxID=2603222 RepID=UPI0021C2A668|nr:ROK family protein [Paenibacillus sp. N3.4]